MDKPVPQPSDVHIVIMAGGRGTRFWPRSRIATPKQFLNIVGTDSMIRQTFDRVKGLAAPDGIWVITNADYQQQVATQLPELADANILIEPAVRSTAPCIGLAALHIRRRNPDAIMIVLPSDHFIPDQEAYHTCLTTAIEAARKTHGLITIGIQPVIPETGYGYIEAGDWIRGTLYRVSAFREKPDRVTAERFLTGGKHLWNSGMFIWSVSTILANLAQHCPEIYQGLMAFEKRIGSDEEWTELGRIYSAFPALSIDYAVMEHADDVFVVKGGFAWSDIGSWSAVEPFWERDEQGNAMRGNVIDIDTCNSIVVSEDKLVALIGVENLIIINTPDVVLVCRKDRDQDIKKVIESLERNDMNEYL